TEQTVVPAAKRTRGLRSIGSPLPGQKHGQLSLHPKESQMYLNVTNGEVFVKPLICRQHTHEHVLVQAGLALLKCQHAVATHVPVQLRVTTVDVVNVLQPPTGAGGVQLHTNSPLASSPVSGFPCT